MPVELSDEAAAVGVAQYSGMDICMNNWLGWDKALMSEPNGDPRDAWVTEFGIKDNWISCATKGNWLQHGFLFLGHTFGVPKVLVHRFSRNMLGSVDSWAQTGVYASDASSGDWLNGYKNCGLYKLADVAG